MLSNWSMSLKNLGLVVLALSSISMITACGKEKTSTEVQRRSPLQTSATQATAESCQAEDKLLDISGQRCIEASECVAEENMQEGDGQCSCAEGYRPSADGMMCEAGEAMSTDEATMMQQATASGAMPQLGAPLGSFREGSGQVNIQCTSQARIQELNLIVDGDNGEPLELRYTMSEAAWFSMDQAQNLIQLAGSDAEANMATIQVTCLMDCAAFRFVVSAVDQSQADNPMLNGEFYGIPDMSCSEDQTMNSRMMMLSTQLPTQQAPM